VNSEPDKSNLKKDNDDRLNCSWLDKLQSFLLILIIFNR
jgi:hypothetical protein